MLNSSRADGQLNAIGCLPMAIPFILLSATANEEEAVSHVTASHSHSESHLILNVNVRVCPGVCGGGVREAHSSSRAAGAAGVSVRSRASRHAERSLSAAAGGGGAQIAHAGRLGRVSTLHTAGREVSTEKTYFIENYDQKG